MPTTLNIRQSQLNINLALQLEVLTPVHIGAATEKRLIENLDFFWEDGTVYYIDPEKLYHALAENDAVGKYERCLLSANTKMVRDLLDDLDIDPAEVSSHRFAFPGEPEIEIRPFIRNGAGLAYIPGSSLKGAIRSAIFEHIYSDPNTRVQDMTKRGRNNEPVPLLKTEYDQALLGPIENSIMRYIRPNDAALTKSELATIEVINLQNKSGQWISRYDETLLSTVEVAPAGSKGRLRLSISDGLIASYRTNFQNVRLPRFLDKVINAQPADTLFKIINGHTVKHLDREIRFFQAYPQAQDTEFIIQNLEALRSQAQGMQNGCILRLGWGNGFHGITGDWRFIDHTRTITNPDTENPVYHRSSRQREPARYKTLSSNAIRTYETNRQREPARYKTRKIAGKDTASCLMGFVKLTLNP